jgi:hypothetical protein
MTIISLALPLPLPVSINTKMVRWTGLVARMGERRGENGDWVGKSERNHLENVRVDGRTILK